MEAGGPAPGVGCAGRGIIANSMGSPYAKEIIDDFAANAKTQIMEYIPRSITVTQCELQGKTTIEAASRSVQANIYRSLAKKIADHSDSETPSPMEVTELREWAAKRGDFLLTVDREKVSEGTPI